MLCFNSIDQNQARVSIIELYLPVMVGIRAIKEEGRIEGNQRLKFPFPEQVAVCLKPLRHEFNGMDSLHEFSGVETHKRIYQGSNVRWERGGKLYDVKTQAEYIALEKG